MASTSVTELDHLYFPQFYNEGTRMVQMEDFVMAEEDDEEIGDDPEETIQEITTPPAVSTLPAAETSQNQEM